MANTQLSGTRIAIVYIYIYDGDDNGAMVRRNMLNVMITTTMMRMIMLLAMITVAMTAMMMMMMMLIVAITMTTLWMRVLIVERMLRR